MLTFSWNTNILYFWFTCWCEGLSARSIFNPLQSSEECTGCTQSLCQQRTGVSTFGKESRRQGLASLLEAQEHFNNKIKHNVNRPFVFNVSTRSHTYRSEVWRWKKVPPSSNLMLWSIYSACLFVCSCSVVLLNAMMASRDDQYQNRGSVDILQFTFKTFACIQ